MAYDTYLNPHQTDNVNNHCKAKQYYPDQHTSCSWARRVSCGAASADTPSKAPPCLINLVHTQASNPNFQMRFKPFSTTATSM